MSASHVALRNCPKERSGIYSFLARKKNKNRSMEVKRLLLITESRDLKSLTSELSVFLLPECPLGGASVL